MTCLVAGHILQANIFFTPGPFQLPILWDGCDFFDNPQGIIQSPEIRKQKHIITVGLENGARNSAGLKHQSVRVKEQ